MPIVRLGVPYALNLAVFLLAATTACSPTEKTRVIVNIKGGTSEMASLRAMVSLNNTPSAAKIEDFQGVPSTIGLELPDDSSGDLKIDLQAIAGQKYLLASGSQSFPITARQTTEVEVPLTSETGECPNGWCWDNPLKLGSAVHAIWAFDNKNVQIMGERGLLAHWDGDLWKQDNSLDDSAVSISLNRNLYTWRGTWANDVNNIWMIPFNAYPLFWNGVKWISKGGTLGNGNCRQLWASGPNDVWTPCRGGKVSHYDGVNWTQPTTGSTVDLWGVWGSKANDVWFVGNLEALHWDGSSMSKLTLPTEVHAVWVDPTGADVWAVGRDSGGGPLFKYNTTTSRFMPEPATVIGYLYAIKGVSRNDIWAAGAGGTVIHYDGTSWKAIPTGIANTLFSISVINKDDIWFAGDGTTVIHWDGTKFTTMLGGRKTLKAVWGSSLSDIWAVGTQGAIRHYDGSAWKDVPSPLGAKNLFAIWGSSATDIWAAGEGLIHYDGTKWTATTGAFQGGYSIWGAASNRIWVSAGGGQIGRYNGTEWNIERPSNLAGGIYNVAGNSEQNVWAVDETGDAARFDGSSWQPMGNVGGAMAVNSGMVVLPDGTVWLAPGNSPSATYIRWQPSNPTWVKVLGPGGGTAGVAIDLWANRADDIWGVGTTGTIHHFNGTDWELSRGDSYGGYPGYDFGPGHLFGVWGIDGNVWAVGDEGTILSRRK